MNRLSESDIFFSKSKSKFAPATTPPLIQNPSVNHLQQKTAKIDLKGNRNGDACNEGVPTPPSLVPVQRNSEEPRISFDGTGIKSERVTYSTQLSPIA